MLQRASVTGELLPAGTGEPDQTATLVNTPVIEDSVRLTVNGELWERTDDLSAAVPEVPPAGSSAASVLALAAGSGACRALPVLAPAPAVEPGSGPGASAVVFTVDRESGEIRFGDGAHGARPPRGAVLQASYDYGGGLAGMVGIGAIKKASLAGLKVSNPVPTWGGDEAESVADAEKAIPATLHHRERLVSAEDCEQITRRTPGVDLGRVEVLPTFHPQLPAQTSEGVVTVVVLPLRDPLHPAAPRPDRLFLETVCRYLEPRRVLTTELYVVGPEYVPVWVSVGIDVVPGRDQASVRAAVEDEIRRFLSPLAGGFEGTGWPLGKTVEALELWAAANRVDGVAKVNSLRLGDAAGAELERLELAGVELPELVNAVAEPGDAPTLDEVRGEVETPTGDTTTSVVPVPVVPEEC